MRQGRSIYFLAIILLPALFTLKAPYISETIHGVSSIVIKPVLSAGHSVSSVLTDVGDYSVAFWKTFNQEVISDERIARLESKISEYEEIQRENARLKKLLDLRDAANFKAVGARIIGWDPSLVRKVVMLDKGTLDGVYKDMPIVVSEGLMGRVFEHGASMVKVILLIDPNSRVSAVATESRAKGIVSGDGTQKLHMVYLGLDSGVQLGEEVITSGISQIFPRGLRIGKISSIQRSFDGLHLMADIEPYVNFSKLEEVLCLDSSQRK